MPLAGYGVKQWFNAVAPGLKYLFATLSFNYSGRDVALIFSFPLTGKRDWTLHLDLYVIFFRARQYGH